MNTTQIIECPTCYRPRRVRKNGVDACGFQTFQFECIACGAAVCGIFDPSDNVPLTAEFRHHLASLEERNLASLRWSRLSEQIFRFHKRNVCQGWAAKRRGGVGK